LLLLRSLLQALPLLTTGRVPAGSAAAVHHPSALRSTVKTACTLAVNEDDRRAEQHEADLRKGHDRMEMGRSK
jgi:hypothetical protein